MSLYISTIGILNSHIHMDLFLIPSLRDISSSSRSTRRGRRRRGSFRNFSSDSCDGKSFVHMSCGWFINYHYPISHTINLIYIYIVNLFLLQVLTFVALIMDVSVVSLMPVASVRLTGHETEPGVVFEELMMVRAFMYMSCVCVNQLLVSCLTYLTSS